MVLSVHNLHNNNIVVANDIDIPVLSVLTFNSRRRGLMQLPGYLGSLISNPSSKILDIHLIVDTHGYLLLNDCYSSLSPLFYKLTIKKFNYIINLHHYNIFNHFLKLEYLNQVKMTPIDSNVITQLY